MPEEVTVNALQPPPAQRAVEQSVLTPEEVAEQLRVSRPTIHAWLKIGRLRRLRAGKAWRIRPEDLAAYLQPELVPEARAQAGTRKYSREEILEFLEADQLDSETKRKVERLLSRRTGVPSSP